VEVEHTATGTSRQASGGDRHLKFYEARECAQGEGGDRVAVMT
jgi:hypothetical protein